MLGLAATSLGFSGQSALITARAQSAHSAGTGVSGTLENSGSGRIVIPPSVRNEAAADVPDLPGQPRGSEEPAPFTGGRPGGLIDAGALTVSQNAPTAGTGEEDEGPDATVVVPPAPDDETEAAEAEAAEAEDEGSGDPNELTEEEQEVVDDLKERDAEVRRHEQAHAAVGGPYAGSPSYTYQQGPDGRRYAVGGEVSIDTAPIEGDPEATIRKLETVRRAALAPAEPSPQDQRVAAQASAGILQAQGELSAQRREEQDAALAESRGEDTVQRDTRPNVDPQDRADSPFEPAEIRPLGQAEERENGFGVQAGEGSGVFALDGGFDAAGSDEAGGAFSVSSDFGATEFGATEFGATEFGAPEFGAPEFGQGGRFGRGPSAFQPPEIISIAV